MKTRTSNQDVGDATTSRAPANGPQNANKPMKNQRNFLQNPQNVRKKRRRAASPYYSGVRKKAEKSVFWRLEEKKKNCEDRRENAF